MMIAEPSANPFLLGLLFVLRCLVPLALMLGVSHLLRRWGLISEPGAAGPPEPDQTGGDFDPGLGGDVQHGQA
jgi:hypothetical protein